MDRSPRKRSQRGKVGNNTPSLWDLPPIEKAAEPAKAPRNSPEIPSSGLAKFPDKSLFGQNRRSAPSSFAELFERLGTSALMRVQAFDPRRSYQLGPAEELCTMSGSSFLLADTGTGKTVVGAIEIGRILQSGKIALVVTPEAHLTSQWQAVLLRSLNVKESEIFICSGESLTDRKRGAMMKEGIKIIIATPEALTRDIAAASPRIDLSRVGRAILDEADLIEGRTDYASLNKQLLEHRVRRTLMSATVASGYKKSKDKLASFGITIGDLVVMRGRKGKLYDQTFRLSLTPDILYPAQKILESYRTCLLDIQSRLDKLTRSSGPSSRAAQSVFDEVRKAHE